MCVFILDYYEYVCIITNIDKRNGARQMTKSAEKKIAQLFELKQEKYTKQGLPNAKAAAGYAVIDILNMLKGQEQYLDQLLDEEIEDAIKALKVA